MESLIQIGVLSGAVLVGLIAIGFIFSRLYRRASKEMAFVRTGLGGQKVIMDGGAIVLPVFHEIIPVNMNTLKLEVERRQQESLIAKDRMRVDVVAAFFVRVKQTAEAVSTAAQTLGQRTLNPDSLKALVEDKFVDSLRATAATMTMQELQDKRRDFVQAVQNAVAEDLEKNGLELESVSLTKLDQTDKKFFNPDNAFDAEGLTRLTQETENRRRERNEIEQTTEVQVRTKNLEATREKLTIEQQTEFATLEQQRQVATVRAEQQAQVAQQEAQRQREADEARIEASRQVEQKKIEAERQVKQAQIEKDLGIQTRQIEADRQTQIAQAEQRRQVELANADTQIAVADKSKDQSIAEAKANEARAEAAKAEESVKTAREVAVAEREKQIQLIEAQQTAEQAAIATKVAATAEKDAAVDRAEAIRVEAQAKREAALAEAAGLEAINAAHNSLSTEQIAMRIRTLMLEKLPEIIAEAVKPMEKIDSIRVVQVNGLGGSMQGEAVPGMEGVTLPDQVANAALKYSVQKPLVDSILREVGLNGLAMNELGNAITASVSGLKANGQAGVDGVALPTD
ncbi:MAG: flotillin family protein [Betaproteobacteria bacterium]